MYFFWGSNLFRVCNQKSRTPSDGTCFGEPPGGFCDVSCHFIFISSFCCCCSFADVLHWHYFFRHHPSPYHGLSAGFYTHFVLSAQPIAQWLVTLSFSTISLSSYREHYCLEWAFFTSRHFLPYAPSWHFWHKLLLSRLPWELAVIPWNLKGFILILKTQTRPICSFDSQ